MNKAIDHLAEEIKNDSAAVAEILNNNKSMGVALLSQRVWAAFKEQEKEIEHLTKRCRALENRLDNAAGLMRTLKAQNQEMTLWMRELKDRVDETNKSHAGAATPEASS